MTACRKCKGEGKVTVYDRIEPFNPSSSPQVAALIKSFGLKMPMKRGENRETTEAKYLKRFGKRADAKCKCKGSADCPLCRGTGKLSFKIFKSILDYRQRKTIIGTFIWPLDENNRVHTVYTLNPSTLRKSSKNVNLQNIPKRVELADMLRECIIAPPGHVLMEADAAAIEAVLMGFACGDPMLVKISKAGVHDFFMSHVRGVPIDPTLPFDELRDLCQKAKKYDKSLPQEEQIRERCKRTIHGTHYGLTPFGMADEHAEEFPTMAVAAEFQDRYLSLVPSVRQYMKDVRERAHRETYIDNHYQYRHYFYDVFSWDSRRQTWTLGEDAKRCVAFVPQSDGSAVQTEDLLRLNEHPSDLPSWLRLIIHDSFILELPESEASWVAQEVAKVMTRTRPELGGLDIGCEIKVGHTLRERDMSVVFS